MNDSKLLERFKEIAPGLLGDHDYSAPVNQDENGKFLNALVHAAWMGWSAHAREPQGTFMFVRTGLDTLLIGPVTEEEFGKIPERLMMDLEKFTDVKTLTQVAKIYRRDEQRAEWKKEVEANRTECGFQEWVDLKAVQLQVPDYHWLMKHAHSENYVQVEKTGEARLVQRQKADSWGSPESAMNGIPIPFQHKFQLVPVRVRLENGTFFLDPETAKAV
jgi:hypothetical protein